MKRNTNKQALAISKRMLTPTEFVEVTTFADALQTIDHQRTDKSRLDALLSRGEILDIEQHGIPIQALFDNANTLGIDPKYITRALARYPSKEEIEASLESIGSRPTIIVIAKEYFRSLLDTLNTEFPQNHFKESSNYSTDSASWIKGSINQVTEVPTEVRFLGFKIKNTTLEKHDKLAEICLSNGDRRYSQIDLYNPLFLQACKPTLKKLENKFKKYIIPIQYFHHY
ncbi:MAG TPA: hypothetical protein VI815_03175 [Candidatus Nanoarchaeia archaeon]|nr:hypothetical protein [Candidatus Nanoarchaeia archaeon]